MKVELYRESEGKGLGNETTEIDVSAPIKPQLIPPGPEAINIKPNLLAPPDKPKAASKPAPKAKDEALTKRLAAHQLGWP